RESPKVASPVDIDASLGPDRAIVEGFVVESREHLATAEARLLALEQDPREATAVADLFRAFHSIKGVAGLLGLPAVVELTRALESVLDGARKGTRPLDRAAIDALLAARDLLVAQVGRVEAGLARGAADVRLPAPAAAVAALEAVLSPPTLTLPPEG